jgi:2-polyprenyl-6-methoxyphenol hydroxylase-like FAD-dependent oxidoreductase
VSDGLELPVAIVGGGIAGLALARAIDGAGGAFALYERRRADVREGLAVNLPGNAIAALTVLGLRDRIEEVGLPIRRREYRTCRDRILFAVDEDLFWGPDLRPRSVMRADLIDMLSEGLPADSISHGAAVMNIEQSRSRVTFDVAGAGSADARLLVGADGVRSYVRGSVVGDGGVRHASLAQASWRFMARNPGVDCWTVWSSREAVILLMPTANDGVYGWLAATDGGNAEKTETSLHDLAAEFPTRVRTALEEAISIPGAIHHSPLEEVRLSQWYNGRVGLIGDAAHATAPVWAEGIALALEDAIVLARLISARWDAAVMLESFQAERLARVAHVQRQTDAMSRAAKLPPLLRTFAMPLVGPRRYRATYEPLKAAI